jgi:hypothetical protein
MSGQINAGAVAKYVGIPLAGAAVIAAGLQLTKGWGDPDKAALDPNGDLIKHTDSSEFSPLTVDGVSVDDGVGTSAYASRPLDEIASSALEAFSQFAPGWNDKVRSGVVAAAVAGPRALTDIRPAMAEAFDAFGTGWGDGPRAAVVAAALLGQRPTDEIRSAIITAHNEFGSGWSTKDRSLVMAGAAMSDRTNREISEVMREVFDVLPASAGWTDSDRATVLAAAVAGNRPANEIRDAALEAFSIFGDGWSDEDRVRVVAAAVGDEASTKMATVKALVSGNAAGLTLGADITPPPGSTATGNVPAVAVPNSEVIGLTPETGSPNDGAPIDALGGSQPPTPDGMPPEPREQPALEPAGYALDGE